MVTWCEGVMESVVTWCKGVMESVVTWCEGGMGGVVMWWEEGMGGAREGGMAGAVMWWEGGIGGVVMWWEGVMEGVVTWWEGGTHLVQDSLFEGRAVVASISEHVVVRVDWDRVPGSHQHPCACEGGVGLVLDEAVHCVEQVVHSFVC